MILYETFALWVVRRGSFEILAPPLKEHHDAIVYVRVIANLSNKHMHGDNAV